MSQLADDFVDAGIGLSVTPLPRALIVDPDADTRLLYKTVLERYVMTIVEAEDGAEALGKALHDRPALIITETRLPRVDGIALCQLLRGDPLTAGVRVVMVTAAASPDVASRAAAAGATAVLVKPCDIDELRATVHRMCCASPPRPDGPPPGGAGPTRTTAARRLMRSHQHDRRFTTEPPKRPPAAFCPRCATPLTYLHSHTGGVSDKYPEQWDYFTCENCGGYRYRHRTRRLTPVVDIDDLPPHRLQ